MQYYVSCLVQDCGGSNPLIWVGTPQTAASYITRVGGAQLGDSGFEFLDANGNVLYQSNYNVCGVAAVVAIPSNAKTIRAHGSGANGNCSGTNGFSVSTLFFNLWIGTPDSSIPAPATVWTCSYVYNDANDCITTPM
jgi:hypothetical protein